MKFFNKNFIRNLYYRAAGRPLEFDLARYQMTVDAIKTHTLSNLTDDSICRQFHALVQEGVDEEDGLEHLFALVSEACYRILGMRPFDVQLIAGLAMCRERLVEMKTGEGKTLAAVFPVIYFALKGAGVHVFTANDYLAQRDAEWMGPLYRFFGLSVASISEKMTKGQRREAYQADITYLTAKQAGFDFLSDSISLEKEALVQRGFRFCLVDEADSILIDEARIPLVIAGDCGGIETDFSAVARLVAAMEEGQDYSFDEYRRNIFLTDSAISNLERHFNCNSLHDDSNRALLTAINLALHAAYLLERDRDYIVDEGRVLLVDEFTGRVTADRRWPDGIQQAVEAKEGVRVQKEGRVLASITLQHFLTLYPHIAAMTATAKPAADEFKEFYGLTTVVVPPNRACIRDDRESMIFATSAARDAALVEEIASVHQTGQPVLVGTGSVADSERIAALLSQKGVRSCVLNAKNHRAEAAVIAKAGSLDAVTISTNMAGRGTDIHLGGEAGASYDQVKSLGGLYVIGINMHESRRIDDQLRGRAGRQGDPGSSCFFLSLEDDLMQRYAVNALIPHKMLEGRGSGPLASRYIHREVNRLQRIVEGQNFEIRKTLRRYADIVEKQRCRIGAERALLVSEEDCPQGIMEHFSGKRMSVSQRYGHGAVSPAMRRIAIQYLDYHWSRHLASIRDIREGIHLHRYAGRDPLQEFMRTVHSGFERMQERIIEDSDKMAASLRRGGDAISDSPEMKIPASTWTYLVNDDPFSGLGMQLAVGGAVGAAPMALLVLIASFPFVLLAAYLRKKRMKNR